MVNISNKINKLYSDAFDYAVDNQFKYFLPEHIFYIFLQDKKVKEYFEKNNTITESYKFTSKIVSYFCNKYRK